MSGREAQVLSSLWSGYTRKGGLRVTAHTAGFIFLCHVAGEYDCPRLSVIMIGARHRKICVLFLSGDRNDGTLSSTRLNLALLERGQGHRF